LVAINFEDVTASIDGIRIIIRASKTDGEGHGQTIAIPNGRAIRPVDALQIWLEAAEITSGSVFQRVRSGGKLCGVSATGACSMAAVCSIR
jgi:hypothetical protein